MKLWILSDLHLGHHGGRVSLLEPEHDVMICAGDVRGDLSDAIDALETVTGSPAILVAGNHEFYGFEGASLDVAYELGHRRAADSACHLLERTEVVIDGFRFLGCTLWTDYKLFGDDKRIRTMQTAEVGLNDHRAILLTRPGKPSEPFRPHHAYRAHSIARQWLTDALARPHDGPTIVVTHHGPHRGSLAPQFEDDLLSAAFVSHMPELLEGSHAPDLWVHGHTHVACDYRAGRCRVICNPMGYPHEYTGAALDLVIEI